MQREIDHLKKELRHAQQKRTPSQFDSSSDSENNSSYRRRSRLLLVSLSHMKRNTTTNVDTRAQLVEAWELTL